MFRVDALGAFFLAWSLPLTLLGTIYAVGYLQPFFERGRNGGTHFALLNLTALSFVLIYTVQNALVFLLGWEIAAVAAWLMVIWDYKNQKIRFAGFNYLVSTHVGLFVLVAAFMLLHSATDSMDLADFGRFLALWPHRAASDGQPKVAAIDLVLHAERLLPGRGKRDHEEAIAEIPAGCFLRLGDDSHLVTADGLLPWSPFGYGRPIEKPARGQFAVLTPRSILEVIRRGYRPALHPTAAAI